MGRQRSLGDDGLVQTKLTDHDVLAALRAAGAGPGSIVTVEDRFGRLAEYELFGDDSSVIPRRRVKLSSSAGLALRGARIGDVVWFPEGDGRPRRFTVHAVTTPPGRDARDRT
jgi:transcription elongation GreA/GreB family factor